MSTKLLFWDDAYQTECTAKVTKIEGKVIELDQTCFYAFSGGQESDYGSINNIPVVKAVKHGEKGTQVTISYELEQEPTFAVGDTVTVKIDPERRSKLRNLHSAVHFVYYFASQVLGNPKVIGSHKTQDKARIDFKLESNVSGKLPEIEEKVNTFLAQGHNITMSLDKERQNVRWWRCGEWEMECGGTHVNNTKEIGQVKLKRKNIGSGKERIEIMLVDT